MIGNKPSMLVKPTLETRFYVDYSWDGGFRVRHPRTAINGGATKSHSSRDCPYQSTVVLSLGEALRCEPLVSTWGTALDRKLPISTRRKVVAREPRNQPPRPSHRNESAYASEIS